MTTNPLVNDIAAKFLKVRSYDRGSLDFLLGQLRILVKFAIDLFIGYEIRTIFFQGSLSIHDARDV